MKVINIASASNEPVIIILQPKKGNLDWDGEKLYEVLSDYLPVGTWLAMARAMRDKDSVSLNIFKYIDRR